MDELQEINDWLSAGYHLIPDEIMQCMTTAQVYYSRLVEIAHQVRGMRDEKLQIFISKADTDLKQEAYKDLRKTYTADQDRQLEYLNDLIKACTMRFDACRSQLSYIKTDHEQSKALPF